MSERQVTDPMVLRALTHPLRRRLLYALTATGPATATSLAAELEVPVNSVSFHLHQLGKYGLIEEAPERQTSRKERWWRLSHDGGMRWSRSDLGRTPEGKLALEVFEDAGFATQYEMIETFRRKAEEWPADWQRAAFFHDWPMRMTPAELSEFNIEVLKLLRKWRKRQNEPRSDDDAADETPVAVFVYGFPFRP